MKNLQVSKPILILDKARAVRNIERMAAKARKANVIFRPHFKTHQSAEIGEWFRDFGVNAITVSSVDMAIYFADSGWSDITIAFPINLLELDKISSLAESISLGILIDSDVQVEALQRTLTAPAKIWIKIDAGYGRAGIPWEQADRIVLLAQKIHQSPKFNFMGILAHNGHTYHERRADGVKRVHQEAMSRLLSVKSALNNSGIDQCNISVGDTPSCSIVDDFSGVDEIRPGNFIFYDIMQTAIGSCTDDRIAVAVACPVVSKYHHRKQILIYGGAVHFSKENIIDDSGRKIFGYVTSGSIDSMGQAIQEAPVVSLTQEHGIISVTDELLSKIDIGDVVLVFPIHSCLTCNLYKEYHTLDGEIIGRI